MEEEYNTDDSLAGDAELTSADGSTADSDVVSVKDLLGETLGKQFKSDEAALKAVKDTFKYVSGASEFNKVVKEAGLTNQEAIQRVKSQPSPTEEAEEFQAQPSSNDYISKDQYNRDMFYSKNPEYAPHQELIDSLSASIGKPLSEVVETDAFKSIYDKAVAYDESETSKSVLQSNPRLGQITDKMTKAKSALVQSHKSMMEGNQPASIANYNNAKGSAVEAVLDAFEE